LTRSHDQADAAFEQKCRPLCTLQLCTRRPRAVCSAREVAETERPCQGTCQHTSCRACAMEEDTECVKCTGRDFRCLKQFGRCVARKRCRGKGGRRSCRKSRLVQADGLCARSQTVQTRATCTEPDQFSAQSFGIQLLTFSKDLRPTASPTEPPGRPTQPRLNT
ncbi:hypothetical protein BaRGS_00039960, partial [Batillaria attramentaria]